MVNFRHEPYSLTNADGRKKPVLFTYSCATGTAQVSIQFKIFKVPKRSFSSIFVLYNGFVDRNFLP